MHIFTHRHHSDRGGPLEPVLNKLMIQNFKIAFYSSHNFALRMRMRPIP